MSRTMQQRKQPEAPAPGGTPIWVWAVYVLGILAASILVFSLLFTLGAYLLSNDVPVTVNWSLPALLLWSGLALLAAAIFLRRRRRR